MIAKLKIDPQRLWNTLMHAAPDRLHAEATP